MCGIHESKETASLDAVEIKITFLLKGDESGLDLKVERRIKLIIGQFL